jgi:NAD(P)H-flavin reductase
VENGYGTEIIFKTFKVGDIVELEGPMGDELVPNGNAEKLLFVANGIGITPFIPLVKEAVLKQPLVKEVKLLYGARYDDDFLYDDYFRQLDNQYQQFEYLPIISRPKNSNVRKGHVTDILREMDLQEYKVYMCGTKNMVLDSYKILLNKGVKKDDIFYEIEEKINELDSNTSVA